MLGVTATMWGATVSDEEAQILASHTYWCLFCSGLQSWDLSGVAVTPSGVWFCICVRILISGGQMGPNFFFHLIENISIKNNYISSINLLYQVD